MQAMQTAHHGGGSSLYPLSTAFMRCGLTPCAFLQRWQWVALARRRSTARPALPKIAGVCPHLLPGQWMTEVAANACCEEETCYRRYHSASQG